MKWFAALLFLCLASCANAATPQLGYTVFSGRIEVKSANQLIQAIETANKVHLKALIIVLDSHGGDIGSGYRMAQAIEASKTLVVCLVDTSAYSMAFGLLQSCPIRIATKRSTLMAHQVHTASDEWINETEAQNTLDRLVAWDQAFATQCARRLTISLEEYKAKVSGSREWWLTPAEAMKVGAIDQVADSLQQVMMDVRKMLEESSK